MIIDFQQLQAFVLSKPTESISRYPDKVEQIKQYISSLGIDFTNDLNNELKCAIYIIKNDLKAIPECPTCGNKVKFKLSGNGYHKYCSSKCSAISKNTLEKRKNTVQQKYGIDNVFQMKEVKEKLLATNLQKYGTAYYVQSKQSKEHRIANPIKFVQSQESIQLAAKNRKIHTYNINFAKYADKVIPLFTVDEYKGGGRKHLYKWKCVVCNTIFDHYYTHDKNGMSVRCPKCNKETDIEKFVSDFLQKHNIAFSYRNRSLITPYELDFYIDSKKIAIEANGLYWHSNKVITDNNYHQKKWQLCKDAGIRLIQIFDDEIRNKPKVVIARLKHILGLTKRTIYARKCVIKPIIENSIKTKFLNKYHIQGADNASIKLGAYYRNHLVAVMTWCRPRIAMGNKNIEGECWELSRFATVANFNIVGIASKLLSYFCKNYEWSKMISYADIRWSNGGVYEKMGFRLDHISKPNYFYSKDCLIRIHRYNFRKSELAAKLESFDPNLSETVNMDNNGFIRVFDAGNLIYYLYKTV